MGLGLEVPRWLDRCARCLRLLLEGEIAACREDLARLAHPIIYDQLLNCLNSIELVINELLCFGSLVNLIQRFGFYFRFSILLEHDVISLFGLHKELSLRLAHFVELNFKSNDELLGIVTAVAIFWDHS